jgi:hypothetical protein
VGHGENREALELEVLVLLKFDSYLGLLFFGRVYSSGDFLFPFSWIRHAVVAKLTSWVDLSFDGYLPFSVVSDRWRLRSLSADAAYCCGACTATLRLLGAWFLATGPCGDYKRVSVLGFGAAPFLQLYSYLMYRVGPNASLFLQKCLSEGLTQEELLGRLDRSGFSRLKAVAVHHRVS